MSRYRWAEIYDWAGVNVSDTIRNHFPIESRVLDVGAGQGKYRIVLNDYPNVDGVEVHKPTADREQLEDLYRELFVDNACYVLDRFARVHEQFLRDVNAAERGDTFAPPYDVVIFGDVLEHMNVADAQCAITDALIVAVDVFVIVPYLYPQEPHDDNEHQRHIQDDLTPEVMASRYPDLRLVLMESHGGEPYKGIYRRR